VEYLETFPNSQQLYRAQIGLANSYFNVAQYQAAIDIWRELVHDHQRAEIIESALKGLQTSYQRINRLGLFSEFLHLSILRSNDRDFQISIYEFRANFEYEQRNYTASVQTINALLRAFPEKREDQRIMVLLANNYTWLNRFEEADQIYIELSSRSNDPYIFYEWGHIKWAQGDHVAAIRRFKRAADNSRNEQYWITLLEKMIEQKDDEFIRYYEQFITFASAYHRTLAMLHLVDWQVYLGDLDNALETTSIIISTNFPQLRARGIFKRGEIQFMQRNFDDAQTNFLRIRYLFNDFSELRWTAELYMAKIYLAQGDRTRARNLFESIRGNLRPEQIAEFNSLL
jgi:tetratricopeptide (TPR) repeat protein